VDVQTTINAKRLEEVEENARKAEQLQKEQEKQRLKEAAATTVLTPVQPPVGGNLSM